ncbi:energy-coupling factor transporter transmembrane component T [Neobacillus sp. FSL H8-0543]|uniref:energy-coupling factor transporter transmembrane component T n=1 Tax=Neobacillus sp. FSL H8-0543 TaxID=2954672 RepID=UPI00315841DB
MLQIKDKNTFFTRLYPMTKIWASLGIVMGIFLFTNYYISTIVFVLAMVAILIEGMLKEFKVILIAGLLIGVSLFLIQGILNPINETVVWNVIPGTDITFYKEGLIVAVNVYSRIMPLFGVLFLAIRTINMTEFGVSLNKAGLPYKVGFVLTSTFQIIPVFNREMHHIINAQKSRGLETDGNLLSRMKAFIPIMVPLISNSLMKVQNQVIALESKGFNANIKKTHFRNPERTKYDRYIVIFSALFGFAGLIYRIMIST